MDSRLEEKRLKDHVRLNGFRATHSMHLPWDKAWKLTSNQNILIPLRSLWSAFCELCYLSHYQFLWLCYILWWGQMLVHGALGPVSLWKILPSMPWLLQPSVLRDFVSFPQMGGVSASCHNSQWFSCCSVVRLDSLWRWWCGGDKWDLFQEGGK